MDMTGSSAVASEIDLSQCANERIHVPGSIQPHGALIAARASDLTVTHVSTNFAAFMCKTPESVLGRHLSDAIGAVAAAKLGKVGALPGETHTLQALDGTQLYLRSHQTGSHVCIDIEPLPERANKPSVQLHDVLETFTYAATPVELCELAVRGLKALTGYSRVVAYRFDAEGHGQVIAEACDPAGESYLGLHYPGADMPPQARALALRQPVTSVSDTHADQVGVVSADLSEIDLTHSALRSISPFHREFLRNMAVTANMAVAIAQDQVAAHADERVPVLWGMLVCHAPVAMYPGPELRTHAGLVGQVVSLLLRSLHQAQSHALQMRRTVLIGPLVEHLISPRPSAAALMAVAADFLTVLDAQGALVRLGGLNTFLGQTPPAADSVRLLEKLWDIADRRVLAVNDLTRTWPEFESCRSAASGALLLPLGPSTDDAILWFRPERARTVTWGGDPNNHVVIDSATGRLSPRASFAAWQEIVRGSSDHWTAEDQDIARNLRRTTEAAAAERTKAELARLRHYDPLTGLPNRGLLQDRLHEAETAPDGSVALLFLDLDRFKTVNDTMGHSAGDALLIEVASRLKKLAGADATPARLGGDEFVVLCLNQDSEAVTALGETIRLAIEQPFDIAGRSCHISASIGIAIATQAGGVDLVRAADMAMYAAKKAGGNQQVRFEPALFDQASMQFEIEEDMRSALAAGDQFVLLYQPLFAILNGRRRLAGFEALVRWRHPRRGWMSPMLFIPPAEKSGLILPLGDWVLATALRQGVELRQIDPDADLVLNVNVSALQIPQPGFAATVSDALAGEGYPAAALCLEVTESMLTDAKAASVLEEVRKLGVRVAIDDFGVGYSSLSYLRRLPIDSVKLDRSFLEGIEGDPRGKDFVTAVIALAHAAGKPVVFEGIETPEQFAIALGSGTDFVQGFLFAPPLSFNAAADLVKQHRITDAKDPVG